MLDENKIIGDGAGVGVGGSTGIIRYWSQTEAGSDEEAAAEKDSADQHFDPDEYMVAQRRVSQARPRLSSRDLSSSE